jgi:methionyl-tRNA formyltransferase
MVFDEVFLVGSGKIACGCLEALCHAGVPCSAFEGGKPPLSFLRATATRHNVPYVQVAGKKALMDLLEQERRKILIVSANNNFIFPLEVVGLANLRFINFHNALLPKHRGRNAPTWAIYEMDQMTGVTWHQIDAGVDTGHIIAQERINIHPNLTALALVRECMEMGVEVFERILPLVLDGSHPRVVQNSEQETGVHLARDIPNEGRLDPAWSGEKISAFLRSLDYGRYPIFPKPRVELDGTDCVIENYRICPDAGSDDFTVCRDGMRTVVRGKGVIMYLD